MSVGTTGMTVRALAPADMPAVDALLLTDPAALLYHSRNYARFLSNLLGCADDTLVAEEGGVVRGVLPLMHIHTPYGALYNSMPYYGSNGGPIASTEGAAAELISAYNDLVTAPGVLGGTVIANPLAGGTLAGVVGNYSDHRIGQWTELGGDILAKIDPTARRNVQKASRTGMEIVSDAGAMDRLYELHLENMTAMGGNAKGRRFFDLVDGHFRYGSDYEIYTARKAGRIIAALLLFYYNETVEYFTPAIQESERSDQPLSLIAVTAMNDAAARGFRWWNWGGTWPSQAGLYRFKKKWSTMEQRYDYAVQLNDESLLTWPAARFAKEMPGFYAVPFSALHSGGAG